MRRACTFAFTGKTSELVAGPEVPADEQLLNLKAARSAGGFGGAEQLEVWIAGSVKSAKFKPAAQTKKSKS